MNSSIKFALFAIAGIGIGVITAQQAVDGTLGGFARAAGAWTSWPSAGTRNIDPYTRAHFMTARKFPVNSLELSEFAARTDDASRDLETRCVYTVTGAMPQSRWWSIAVMSARGSGSNPDHSGLSSSDAVLEADGSYRINLSRDPQPGNWLRPPEEGGFEIVMRFYNPVSAARGLTQEGLPKVERVSCR